MVYCPLLDQPIHSSKHRHKSSPFTSTSMSYSTLNKASPHHSKRTLAPQHVPELHFFPLLHYFAKSFGSCAHLSPLQKLSMTGLDCWGMGRHWVGREWTDEETEQSLQLTRPVILASHSIRI